MTSYGFTITQYEPGEPWVITGTHHETAELSNDVEFWSWARERWPAATHEITLDSDPFRGRAN